MTVVDQLVADLRAHPDAAAIYLTSKPMGEEGSQGVAKHGDFQGDANAAVVFWDSEEGVLAVDSHRTQAGKIASFREFLARRTELWLTAVSIVDPAAHLELIVVSTSVADLLALDTEQRRAFVRRLWWAVGVAALVLAVAVYYCFFFYSPGTSNDARRTPPPAQLPPPPPPLFLRRRY